MASSTAATHIRPNRAPAAPAGLHRNGVRRFWMQGDSFRHLHHQHQSLYAPSFDPPADACCERVFVWNAFALTELLR